MKQGAGKQKGSSFERQISGLLSNWVSEGENDSVFYRSAMSGGRATIAEKEGNLRKTQSGDLSAIHSMGEPFLNQFYVELKNYKDLNIESFLLKDKGNLAKFWEETCVEARKYDKMPVLIAKENRKPTMIITDNDGSYELALDFEEIFFVTTQKPRHDAWLGYFEDFLVMCDPLNWQG